jgi:hypothetical protein
MNFGRGKMNQELIPILLTKRDTIKFYLTILAATLITVATAIKFPGYWFVASPCVGYLIVSMVVDLKQWWIKRQLNAQIK